jgi:hypothetical protein
MDPTRNPTLLEIEKLEEAGKLANTLTVERPYFLSGILLGTSAFTASGWEGSFYPRGMQSRDFLSYYATQFATVQVDSPRPSTDVLLPPQSTTGPPELPSTSSSPSKFRRLLISGLEVRVLPGSPNRALVAQSKYQI